MNSVTRILNTAQSVLSRSIQSSDAKVVRDSMGALSTLSANNFCAIPSGEVAFRSPRFSAMLNLSAACTTNKLSGGVVPTFQKANVQGLFDHQRYFSSDTITGEKGDHMEKVDFTRLNHSQDFAENKVIKTGWQLVESSNGENVLTAKVLTDVNGVEGLAINRFKTEEPGSLALNTQEGHIFSLLEGEARLEVNSESDSLHIGPGTHIYLPPGEDARMELSSGAYAIHVSGPEEQANGKQLIVRNERFARAARDTLTPQYLSRRIFTNRDQTLESKYGTQVAWFHTTMFDSSGLPENANGDPVFKMSYNNQTEPNVVYEVGGNAAVRFAEHPYQNDANGQPWSEWASLDGETTYYLNETSDGEEVEVFEDDNTGEEHTLRNRHEVLIQPDENGEQGYVSLCCLFDPGPTGLEQHEPGEYSSYAPVSKTLGTPAYQAFVEEMAPIDNMIDTLSLLVARGASEEELHSMPEWSIYEDQKSAQLNKQQQLVDDLAAAGKGRDAIVEGWRLPQ